MRGSTSSREVFWKVVREGRISLTVAAVVEIFAGTLLGMHVEGLIALPVLLAIVPPLNDMAGDLGTIVVARLATSFYLGTMEPRILKNKEIKLNYASLMLVGLIACLYVGLLISTVYVIPSSSLQSIMLVLQVVLMAGMIVVSITLFLGILLSVLTFKNGYDPNIIVIPNITVVGDFLAITSVVIVCRLLGLL